MGTSLKPATHRFCLRRRGCRIRDHADCRGVASVLSRVGDKWSVFVIMMLSDGPKRFNELKRMINGISQRMLTLTLRGLERDGLGHAHDLPDHSAAGGLRADRSRPRARSSR